MAIRTNLVTNPSFVIDANGWTKEGTGPDWGRYGRGYTSENIGVAAIAEGLTRYVYVTAAEPNKPYTASGYYSQISSTIPNSKFGIEFLDSNNVVLASHIESFTPPRLVDAWFRKSQVGKIAPAGTAKVKLIIEADWNGIFWDAFMLEQSPTLGAYYDGATPSTADVTYAWTGAAHGSTSTATTSGSARLVNQYTVGPVSTANTAINVTTPVNSGDVMVMSVFAGNSAMPTAVTGLGATWTAVPGSRLVDSFETWVGVGATGTGTVSITHGANTGNALFRLYHITGTSSTVAAVTGQGANVTSPVQQANSNQVVIATGFSNSEANAIYATAPTTGWSLPSAINTGLWWRGGSRVPTESTAVNHTASASRNDGFNAFVTQVVVGDATAPTAPDVAITSAFSGTGTLGTTLKTSARITSAMSGSGALASVLKLPTKITTAFTGMGTLEAQLNGFQKIRTELSGEGQLGSTHDGLRPEHPVITSRFTSEGSLLTVLRRKIEIVSDFSAEGVLITDLSYADRPEDRSFLGKLSSYTVTGSATPLNPAGGSNALPTMSAVFADAIDPEYAMGTELELESTRIGKHRGEVVSVSTADASDRSSLSVESPLTMLNSERRVYPVIQAPSTWLAARAVDYWTQQCGLFYDRVPGEAIAYASGYGHGLAYIKGHEDERFYEDKPTTITVVNGRSVRLFGADTTATTKLVLNPDESNMTFAKGQRLAFSVGVGLVGTGRSSETVWTFHDEFGTYVVTLGATSAGVLTAKVSQPDGLTFTTHTANVPAGNAYRMTLSIEKLTADTIGATFTVDNDNLKGVGTREFTGSRNIVGFPLPRTATLDSIAHKGLTGGSGADMYRYGTYLTTVLSHPVSLPEVTKVLLETTRAHSFVSGFSGNMWDMLNQYAAINRLDVSFVNNQLVVGPRNKAVTYGAKLSGMNRRASRRDKYQKVALLNQNSKPSLNKDNLLWRADSVYQVNTGEVFETTIQTEHSILELSQPKCVTGIEPFPYESGTGQYVVTGADGYICSPRFWREQGGKIEVELTDKEGEFLVRITGPDRHHETRAPYRISEGAGDRPALYVTGSGVVNKPEQHEINTGARNAKEGYDSVFESPFLTGIEAVYDTASEMAREYSASNAEFSFNEPKEHGVPSEFGQNPSGARLEHECGILRISRADVSASTLSANAVPQTTIADYKASLPAGSKIRDEKAKYRGMTIRQQNIKPLKGR